MTQFGVIADFRLPNDDLLECPTNLSLSLVGISGPCVCSSTGLGADDKLKVRRTFEQIIIWQSEIGNNSNLGNLRIRYKIQNPEQLRK
jgi:hypothetical protein